MTNKNDFEIIKLSKNNIHKFKDYILDLECKEMDHIESKYFDNSIDNVKIDIINFNSENIYLVFLNNYGLIGIIGSKELDKDTAYIWMITTKEIYKHSYRIAKYTYSLISQFQDKYKRLMTYKYVGDLKGEKWLKYNGFYEDGKLYFNDKFKLMIKDR